jgi:organic hydroperoxide reductase OsmC/OhrA
VTGKKHIYTAHLEWTGNTGSGTSAYRAYERTWNLSSGGKPTVECSNDPLLGGDNSKYNPEDLLLAALSSCHMLWYLHLCSEAGITVLSYEDRPEAIGEMERSGKGKFVSATLKPKISVASGCDPEKARALHGDVHRYCFIARSVNFQVHHEPEILIQE